MATIDEANEIQAEWMALESEAPEKKKKRIFALIDKLPKNHLSINKDSSLAQVMISGMPLNQPQTIADCIAYFSHYGFDRTMAWCYDRWIPFPQVWQQIWTTDSYNKKFKEAAQEFARTYWGEPRKVVDFKETAKNSCVFTFAVKDGKATYRLSMPKVTGHGTVYAVERLES